MSAGFEHNNVASIELDPNDKQSRDLWVGTGEPNACGSGCEAGVGLYFSKNGGNSWTGPYGRESFNNRAVGSIAVKPGDSKTIFAASGRAVRGVSNVCCGGADALIPKAPALRTLALDERRRVVGPRQPGQHDAVHRVDP